MGWRVRAAGKLVTNQSVLTEVRDRDNTISPIRKQKRKQQIPASPQCNEDQLLSSQSLPVCDPVQAELESDVIVRSTAERADLSEPEAIEVPTVRVWDYEELKRNYGKWW